MWRDLSDLEMLGTALLHEQAWLIRQRTWKLGSVVASA